MTTTSQRTTRRELLLALGTATTVSVSVGLAGCTGNGGSGDGGGGSGDSDDTPTDTPSGGGDGASHTVDMTDNLTFDPETIEVAPGDTVVWENVGSVGHSVTAYDDGIPGDADYFASGGFDGEQAARDAYPEGDIGGGKTYQHTFGVAGTYEYFCIPHEMSGMKGTIQVTD